MDSRNLLRPTSPAPLLPPVSLADPDERTRLSASAIRAFFAILEKWRVRDADGMELLGGMSNGKYHSLKKAGTGLLNQDQITRVSFLVGIFKALNILYPEDLADAWMTLPNSNRIFQGAAPLAYLLAGGIPAFQTVRRLLDARRGG